MKYKNGIMIHADRLLTEEGFMEGHSLWIKDGIIERIIPERCGDLKAELLVPGFIDNHNHGGHGCSIMSSSDDDVFADWLKGLAINGTTSVVAAPYTDSIDNFRAVLKRIRRIMDLQDKGEINGARILGVHLEGPYISSEKPGIGAMNELYTAEPDVEHFERLVSGYEDMILEITLAPEKDKDFKLISYLREKDIRILAGHTNASYDEGLLAFDAGVQGICHFFNASSGIHHREPGILTAALLNENIYCEAICDFVHVHPAALRILLEFKAPKRAMIVSDAVKLAGMPDGKYYEDGELVIHRDGVSRLKSGGLTGGGGFVLDGVRNLVSLGVPLKDALIMGSKTPAEWLSLRDTGLIREGGKADLAALKSADLSIDFTMVNGHIAGG